MNPDQALAQIQLLPKIILINFSGPDKATRVPEKAAVIARATRPPGPSQARQNLSPGTAAAGQTGEGHRTNTEGATTVMDKDMAPPPYTQIALPGHSSCHNHICELRD